MFLSCFGKMGYAPQGSEGIMVLVFTIVLNVFLLSFSGCLNRAGREWWLTLIAWPS